MIMVNDTAMDRYQTEIKTTKNFSPLAPEDVKFLEKLTSEFCVSAKPKGKTLTVCTCASDNKAAERIFKRVSDYLMEEKILDLSAEGYFELKKPLSTSTFLQLYSCLQGSSIDADGKLLHISFYFPFNQEIKKSIIENAREILRQGNYI